MVDDPASDPAQKEAHSCAPRASPPDDPKDAAPLSANQEGGAHGAHEGREKDNKGASAFLGRLTISEWLTFLVGVGSLSVALLTYLNAADTRDIKKAVRGLATLAAQTKRAADNTHDQLGAMRDQVGALKDQVVEAKAQTRAIAQQTTAIKTSAAAANEHFILDERPILAFVPPTYYPNGNQSDGAGRFVGYNYGIKNVGKTIARDIHTQEMLSINLSTFKSGSGHNISYWSELVPNGTGDSTVLPAAPFFVRFDDTTSRGSYPVIVLVIVDYKDLMGDLYHDQLCLMPRSTTSVVSCGPDDLWTPKARERFLRKMVGPYGGALHPPGSAKQKNGAH